MQFVDGNDQDVGYSNSPTTDAVDDEGETAFVESADIDGIAADLQTGLFSTPEHLSSPRIYPAEASQPVATPVQFVSPFHQHSTPTTRLSVLSPASSAVLYQPQPLWPLSNRSEAALLRYFIDKIGPQLDVTDHLAHFTTIVPQRAVHCPLLLYSIIATASIHRSRMFGQADEFSEEYQAKCVRILIRFLDDLDSSLDENFLASVVVLRKCEEMSGRLSLNIIKDRPCVDIAAQRTITCATF